MTTAGEKFDPTSDVRGELGKNQTDGTNRKDALVAFVQNEGQVGAGLRRMAGRVFTGRILDCVMGPGEDMPPEFKKEQDAPDDAPAKGKDKAPVTKEDWVALAEKQLKELFDGDEKRQKDYLDSFKKEYDRLKGRPTFKNIQADYEKKASDNPEVAEIERAKALMEVVKIGLVADGKVKVGKLGEIPTLSPKQLKVLEKANK